MSGGSHEQVALVAIFRQQFVDLDRALESVARSGLTQNVFGDDTPADQIVTGDFVLAFVGREGIDVTSGYDDRLRPDSVKPPGFVQAAKHGFIDRWKWNQATG